MDEKNAISNSLKEKKFDFNNLRERAASFSNKRRNQHLFENQNNNYSQNTVDPKKAKNWYTVLPQISTYVSTYNKSFFFFIKFTPSLINHIQMQHKIFLITLIIINTIEHTTQWSNHPSIYELTYENHHTKAALKSKFLSRPPRRIVLIEIN